MWTKKTKDPEKTNAYSEGVKFRVLLFVVVSSWLKLGVVFVVGSVVILFYWLLLVVVAVVSLVVMSYWL